jgi:hypothetical protein
MCPITASMAERATQLDEARDPAPLAGDEDAVRIGGVVAAIALVDIGALDCATGELLGGVDDAAERVSVVGIARQRLGVELAIRLHVSDHGLDGGAATQLAFDEAKTPRFWPEMKTRCGLAVSWPR